MQPFGLGVRQTVWNERGSISVDIDETTGVPAARSHRDARRRGLLVIVVYALCLAMLVLAGSYLAPAGALDAPSVPNGGDLEVDPGSRPTAGHTVR